VLSIHAITITLHSGTNHLMITVWAGMFSSALWLKCVVNARLWNLMQKRRIVLRRRKELNCLNLENRQSH
jgi:hypothetical protein